MMSSHAQSALGSELCQRLVIQRTTDGKPQAAPLAELKGLVSGAEGATVIFEIELANLRPSLDSLYELTQSGGDLEVPVRLLNESSLLFIAQGSSAAFTKLERRIRDNRLADRTSFHILSAKALKPLTAPREILQTNEEIERARKGKDPFAVFASNQIVFMIPRDVIAQLDAGELEKKKIIFDRIFRPPNSWMAWLQKRADDFSDKTIISTGEWAAVSSSAFALLQEISGAEGNETPPEMQALNRRILDLLEAPRSAKGSAVAAATSAQSVQVENAPTMSKEAQKIILSYLNAHRGRTQLNEADGIERGFLALAKLAPTDRAAESYRKAIRKIGFTRWEYTGFYRQSQPSVERMTEGWLVFLKTMKNPYADKPVNMRNLQLAIKQLPE
jgi:hypothetical protein